MGFLCGKVQGMLWITPSLCGQRHVARNLHLWPTAREDLWSAKAMCVSLEMGSPPVEMSAALTNRWTITCEWLWPQVLKLNCLHIPDRRSQDNKYLWFLGTRLWDTWIIFSFWYINSITILEYFSVHIEILQTSFITWFGFFEELYLHLKKSTAWYLSIYIYTLLRIT